MVISELNAKEWLQENEKGNIFFSDQGTGEATETWNKFVDLGIKSRTSELENKLWYRD